MGGSPGFNFNQYPLDQQQVRRKPDDPKELARLLTKLIESEGGTYVGQAALIRVFERRWDQLNVLAHRLHHAVCRDEPMTAVRRAAMKAERQQTWPLGEHQNAK